MHIKKAIVGPSEIHWWADICPRFMLAGKYLVWYPASTSLDAAGTRLDNILILQRYILTGKFERNTVPSETKSRVGYITSKEWLACQGAPSWNSYANDEKFWQLMTSLETIAKKHGTFSCSYFWALVSARGILDFASYRICGKPILNLKTTMLAYPAGHEVYFCP